MISAEDYEDLGNRSKRKMMNDWEYGIKPVFKVDAPENQRWYVDIPGYLGIHVPDSVAQQRGIWWVTVTSTSLDLLEFREPE